MTEWTQDELQLIAPSRMAEDQILELQQSIDFDVKEFTLELYSTKLMSNDIFVPDYQRKLIWDDEKRSKFVESLILDIPVPYLFLADNDDGRLEIMDGYQRLSTIRDFLDDKFRLDGLEKLTALIGYKFSDLPPAQARKLHNRTLRAIVLSDKSDPNVRFDIFERINSGSVVLNAAEFRKGAFPGPFYALVLDLAEDDQFQGLCPVGRNRANRGEREELVLRFFAYADRYQDFQHDVSKFLNAYLKSANEGANIQRKREQFRSMLAFVEQHFPFGFRKSKTSKTTPRVRFEAISVGVDLALSENPNLEPQNMDWLDSEQFRVETTTHASNSAPRLQSRVEFVRDRLLGVVQ